MEIPVLIEPVAGNGFRATAFSLVVEGPTVEETIQKLRALMAERLAAGAQVVQVPVDVSPPWKQFAGTWEPDDPLIEEWKKAVEEYRRQVDEDVDRP